jgi:hypothetical protein
MAGAEEKEPENIVHRNAIFCETIRKEQSDQKLYTSYGVNPYKKSKQTCARSSSSSITHHPIPPSVHVVAGKPNSPHDSADGAEDGEAI